MKSMGVNYEPDENGGFARLRAGGEAELDIGDRKDIRIATQKATLRVKANIAKFLNERIISDEVMMQVENKMTETNGKQKTVNRKTTEEHMETIKSSVEEILKGVIVTKVDTNPEKQYVFVEIGYSPRTQAVADSMKKNLNSDLSSGSSNGTSNSTIEQGGQREIKTVKNYDSF